MSIQAAFSDSPRDGAVLAESALNGARELTPAVTASLHARLALSAARTGDRPTWQRAQDSAFDLLARSTPENEPVWIYWFSPADAHGIAGQALLALDRPQEAESHLQRAVALLDPEFMRIGPSGSADLPLPVSALTRLNRHAQPRVKRQPRLEDFSPRRYFSTFRFSRCRRAVRHHHRCPRIRYQTSRFDPEHVSMKEAKNGWRQAQRRR